MASLRTPSHRLAAVTLARPAVARAPDRPTLQMALVRALAGAGMLVEAG